MPLLTFSAAPYDEIRLLVKRVTDVAAGRGGHRSALAVDAGDRARHPPDFARPGRFFARCAAG